MYNLKKIIIIAGVLSCYNLQAQIDTLTDKVIGRNRFGIYNNYPDVHHSCFIDDDTIIINENLTYTKSVEFYYPDAVFHSSLYKVNNDLQILDSFCSLDYRYLATYKINDNFYTVVSDTSNGELSLLKTDFYHTKKDSIDIGIALDSWNHGYEPLPSYAEPNHMTTKPKTDFYLTKSNDFLVTQVDQLTDSTKEASFILFDTLGNVLATKKHIINQREFANPKYAVSTQPPSRYIVQMQPAKGEIHMYVTTIDDPSDWYFGPSVLYHIDDKTLEMKDTGTFEQWYFPQAKDYCYLDDTICLRYSFQGGWDALTSSVNQRALIEFVDTKNHIVQDTIRVIVDDWGETDIERTHFYTLPLIDYRNTDSIYVIIPHAPSYVTENGLKVLRTKVIIANVSASTRKLNFLYYLDEIRYKPKMCRATSDGGCIILGTRGATGTEDFLRKYWLKFNPDYQLSIAEANDSTADITVYPNPAKDMLNIVSSGIIKKIELVNMLGQTVYSSSINSNGMLIHTDCFPKGSYIARIHTAQGITTKNVVIE